MVDFVKKFRRSKSVFKEGNPPVSSEGNTPTSNHNSSNETIQSGHLNPNNSSEDSLNQEGFRNQESFRMPKSWRRSLRKLAWKKKEKIEEIKKENEKVEDEKGFLLFFLKMLFDYFI